MDDTGTRLDDRYFRRITYERDQSLAATGDTEVYITYCRQQRSRGLMGSRKEFHDMRVNIVFLKNIVDDLHLRTVRSVGLLAALEDGGIATLETEGEDIKGDVRTSLEDHADDAEWHADTLQMEAVVERLLLQHMAEGRGKGSDMAHVMGDILQTLRREEQTVVEGIVLTGFLQVFLISLQNIALMTDDGVSDSPEDLIALLVGDQRQRL